jgi:peroxiredoxin
MDRLLKHNPGDLEAEAARLYDRVIADFYKTENNDTRRALPPPPPLLGDAARPALDALRRLTVGRSAPEIDGPDFDGIPMKLSDFRGKVVVLYVERKYVPRGLPEGANPQANAAFAQAFPVVPRPISTTIADLARKMEGKPLVVLGVVAGTDRDAFRKAVQDDHIPGRFWWDQDGRPGSIRTAWDADTPNVYVIGRQGIIRASYVLRPEDLEAAVTNALGE